MVIGDGAEWEIQIVDLFHARQHLWDLVRKLHPNQELEQKRWMTIHQNMLDEGRIERLVAALHSIGSSNLELAETIRKEAAYFETHTAGMRYPEFRNQHLFVGSGVIEAGCKTVIGTRCKQSGMFWCAEPTAFWPCVVATTMANLKITGKAGCVTSTFMSHTLPQVESS